MKYSHLKQLEVVSSSSHPTPDFISYVVFLLRLLQDHISKMHGWHKPFNSISNFHMHPNGFQRHYFALETKREEMISKFSMKSRLHTGKQQFGHCTTYYYEI